MRILQGLTVNTSSICPEVTFICSDMNLQSAVLRWFLNSRLFATYAYSPSDHYPVTVTPDNAAIALNALVDGVDVQILSVSSNEDNPNDIGSIESTMTVNISALQGAGVTNVSCGTINNANFANITFNSSGGKSFMTHIRTVLISSYFF